MVPKYPQIECDKVGYVLLYQTALIAVLYIERDCVIDESKKAFLLLLQ